MSLLLALLSSALLQSACQEDVLLEELDAGVEGLRLWTPKGAPVLNGPFSLQVVEGPPAKPGLLGLSLVESATFLPAFQAIVYPASPLLIPFALDSSGGSSMLVDVPWMDPILCGFPLVAQALVFDATAIGGASFSNGLRMRAGEALRPLFPNAMTPTVDHPRGLITADFNADGQADLAVLGWEVLPSSEDELGILLGDGHGRFNATAFPSEGGDGIARGDLDGDGVLDLATVGDLQGLFVVQGLGGGAFGAPLQVDSSEDQRDVFVADLNGDGEQDLVTRHEFDPTPTDLTLFLGHGDGTFHPGNDVDFAGSPNDAFLVDYDSDGVLDVAVAVDMAGVPDQMGVLVGNGNGSLQPYVPLYLPAEFYSRDQLALTDLDTDGDQDVLLSKGSAFSLDVLLQEPGGGLAFSTNYAGVGDDDFTLADMDGDGRTDLVAMGNGKTVILLASGAGTFSSVIAASIAGAGLAVADFDGDDKTDLAFSATSDDRIVVTRGDGAGGFKLTDVVDSGANELLSATAIADLDGDGAGDLVGTDELLDLVHVALGNGEGSFDAPASFPAGAADPVAVRTADLDGDGRVDVVTAHDEGSAVSVLLGTGGGALAAGAPIPLVGQAADVAVGDLNADGAPDLVAVTWTTHSVAVLLGNGDGSFSAPAPTSPGTGLPFAVELADLDLDGDLDAAAAHGWFVGYLSTLPGNGAGTFGAPSLLKVGAQHLLALDVGDLDFDGVPDAVTGSELGTLTILKGLGGGAFATLEERMLAGTVYEVVLPDLDGDGRRDILAVNGRLSVGDSVAVFRGIGGAAFAPAEHHKVGGAPYALAVGDLDRDGIPDAALTQRITGAGWVVRISTVGE